MATAKKVVVLMPPPVPPGLAPMNISTVKMSRAASVKFESGCVLNPAVRAITDWKDASSSVWSVVQYSSAVPSTSSSPVITMTTFVFRVYFFHLNLQ